MYVQRMLSIGWLKKPWACLAAREGKNRNRKRGSARLGHQQVASRISDFHLEEIFEKRTSASWTKLSGFEIILGTKIS